MPDLEVNVLLQDALYEGLYNREGLFNLLPDQSYRVQSQWADSVDFIVNESLFVAEGVVTKASGNRNSVRTKLVKVNAPFVGYNIPIDEEAEANFMSNGEMADRVTGDSVDALGDKLDVKTCDMLAAGIPAGQKIEFASETVEWKDLVGGGAKARSLKIGASGLLYLVPPALEAEVKDIDVIKLAMSNNANYFENGIGKVDNNFYAFSAHVPQIDGKNAILVANLKMTARATKAWMKKFMVYDEDTGDSRNDYWSYVAMKKLREQAVIALVEKD